MVRITKPAVDTRLQSLWKVRRDSEGQGTWVGGAVLGLMGSRQEHGAWLPGVSIDKRNWKLSCELNEIWLTD